jgi:GNAT superfamily N-acetyltransferase
MEKKEKIGSVNKFTEREIDSFKDLVMSEDQVRSYTFDGLIDKKPILCMFFNEQSKLIACGALKIPYCSHKEEVFSNAKASCNASDFEYEMGWDVVEKNHRGNGLQSELISKRLEYAKQLGVKKVYATIQEDNEVSKNNNERSKHNYEKHGFIREGEPFESSRGKYNIVLYIKELSK